MLSGDYILPFLPRLPDTSSMVSPIKATGIEKVISVLFKVLFLSYTWLYMVSSLYG